MSGWNRGTRSNCAAASYAIHDRHEHIKQNHKSARRSRGSQGIGGFRRVLLERLLHQRMNEVEAESAVVGDGKFVARESKSAQHSLQNLSIHQIIFDDENSLNRQFLARLDMTRSIAR